MSTHRGGEKRRWANLRHVNGVAVYQEHAEQSGAGGAFMVSAVVRATPKACFKVGLLHLHGQMLPPYFWCDMRIAVCSSWAAATYMAGEVSCMH